ADAAPACCHRTVAASPFAAFPFTAVLRSRQPRRGSAATAAPRLRLRVVRRGLGVVGACVVALVVIGFAVFGLVVFGLVVVAVVFAVGIVGRGVGGCSVARSVVLGFAIPGVGMVLPGVTGTVVGFVGCRSSEALGGRVLGQVRAGRVFGIGNAMPAHVSPCARFVGLPSSDQAPLPAAVSLNSRRRRCRIGSV